MAWFWWKYVFVCDKCHAVGDSRRPEFYQDKLHQMAFSFGQNPPCLEGRWRTATQQEVIILRKGGPPALRAMLAKCRPAVVKAEVT